MKKSYFFPIFLLIICTLFSACGSNKKLLISNTHVEQLKKDSIATHRKLDEKNYVAKNNEEIFVKKEKVNSAEKTSSSAVNLKIKKEVISTPLPPVIVSEIFKSHYPTATEISWTRKMPIQKTVNKNTRDYKVIFLLHENPNTIVYTENGDMIESRTQIFPDQLPHNIYNAIKNKYPDAQIVSAATIKNAKVNGAYVAVIKTQKTIYKELILTENGIFVE